MNFYQISKSKKRPFQNFWNLKSSISIFAILIKQLHQLIGFLYTYDLLFWISLLDLSCITFQSIDRWIDARFVVLIVSITLSIHKQSWVFSTPQIRISTPQCVIARCYNRSVDREGERERERERERWFHVVSIRIVSSFGPESNRLVTQCISTDVFLFFSFSHRLLTPAHSLLLGIFVWAFPRYIARSFTRFTVLFRCKKERSVGIWGELRSISCSFPRDAQSQQLLGGPTLYPVSWGGTDPRPMGLRPLPQRLPVITCSTV